MEIKEFLNLKNPPKNIFYKGNLSLLDKRKIAIIGSRNMSVYTKNCIISLASLLKKVDVCVVSGGAIGVDINASIYAMPNTIAIFANGLDNIYPKSNFKYIKQIYENALALSENENNYVPKKYDFLLRNRLIIALSEAVVIAQADLQSGSMQSAKLALKMNKPIYVLPQRAQESDGTNFLLANKQANLIYNFEEFVMKFGNLNKEKDEFLEFCKRGVSLQEALNLYKDKVYEYELDGKIQIDGIFIRVV